MRNSRIIPVALILIIVAIAIAALVSLARTVFFSGGTSQTVSQTDVSTDALLNTAINHSVTMTVRGAIVANEEFRSYKITVTPTTRTLTTYSGYLNTPIDQISVSNNTPAYEQFVYALDRANLVKGTELTGANNDTRGICADGKVYEFGVIKDGKSVKTLWTSSCKESKGSLDANVGNLAAMFIDQIPKGVELINKIVL
ncbi:hypothetical protein EPN95_00060 [Patescibacteria group bacterium]|nr:MAG: hypothetical protein EPN95_00060 [Patescibacteria group bacterium]